eukprot:6456099-Amphidinium_carterae.3
MHGTSELLNFTQDAPLAVPEQIGQAASASSSSALAMPSVGPSHPVLPSETLAVAFKRTQKKAKERLSVFVAELLNDPRMQEATPRVIVNAALDQMDTAGERCWGTDGAYTRRRTLVDSFLKLDYEALAASLRSA